jgi:5'-phosphate synthase pdxT subunit
MVKKLSIGILAVQGAVSEHFNAMTNTLIESNIKGEIIFVYNKNDIKKIDALILPGGESTTISKILYKNGMHEIIHDRVRKNNLPIMGTCAGCVILAKKLTDDDNKVRLLKVMDMQVERNSFGRQRESFEKNIIIEGFSEPYNAVFI